MCTFCLRHSPRTKGSHDMVERVFNGQIKPLQTKNFPDSDIPEKAVISKILANKIFIVPMRPFLFFAADQKAAWCNMINYHAIVYLLEGQV